MKIKYAWFIRSCLLLLLPQLGMAAPLINSQFARRNPGIIPYSSCSLEGFPSGHAALLFGGAPDRDLVWLNCWSKKHGLSSKIPLKVSDRLRVGLGIGFAAGLSIGADVHGLHHKTIRQLLGFYRGIAGNFLGVGIFGAELQYHGNSEGISIDGTAIIGGLDFTLASYSTFWLATCNEGRCTDPYRRDPNVLYANTVYEHDRNSYLSTDNPSNPNRIINLQIAGGEIPLSIGGTLLINEQNYESLRPKLRSRAGDIIHLVRVNDGMSDEMVLVESKDGSLAYHTLEGTFPYREAEELVPDIYQLQHLRFIEDDHDEKAQFPMLGLYP